MGYYAIDGRMGVAVGAKLMSEIHKPSMARLGSAYL